MEIKKNIEINEIGQLELVPYSQQIIVTIPIKAEKEKLIFLESLLELNNEIKVVLVVDSKQTSDNKFIKNLEVLRFIPSLRFLTVLSNSSVRLENINEISFLRELISFKLGGFYKRSLDLFPIDRFVKINELELESGLTKSQHNIIDKFSGLISLKVQELDMSLLSEKKELISLMVNKSIKHEVMIPSLFPKVKEIKLVNCRGVTDFSFLNGCLKLEKLSLSYMNQINSFPKLNHLKNIVQIEMLAATKIGNIENLLFFENLQNLIITDISFLTPEDFLILSSLKKLKVVYTRFKKKEDNEKFIEICEKFNWINKHPSMLRNKKGN